MPNMIKHSATPPVAMGKAVIISLLISGSVCSAVYTQSLLASAKTPPVDNLSSPVNRDNNRGTVAAKEPLPTTKNQLFSGAKIIGYSAQSKLAASEQTAIGLLEKLATNNMLYSHLKQQQKMTLYIIYDDFNGQNVKISTGYHVRDLNKAAAQANNVTHEAMQGNYLTLADMTDQVGDLAKAWKEIDPKKTPVSVVEQYQLDANGQPISGQSAILYREGL